MNGRSVQRWLGLSGLAFVLLEVVALVLFVMAGPPAGLDPADKLVAYYQAHGTLLATTILVYDLSLIPFVVFATSLAAVIRGAGVATAWLGSLVFGLGMVIVAETYVDFALIGAAVADGSGRSNPTTVRTLVAAATYLANTPFTLPLLFFLAAVGYAVWQSRVLSRWLAWVAWIGALLIALTLPSIYGGNDASGFYTADGLVGFLALLPLYVWTVCASIVALRASPKKGLPPVGMEQNPTN